MLRTKRGRTIVLNDLLNLFNVDNKESHAIFDTFTVLLPLSEEAGSNHSARSFPKKIFEHGP